MLIQGLEEYKNRTEYRLLNNFCTYEIVSINELKKGTLVLPGILINKMQKEELKILDLWLEHKENQLFLLPVWSEINLKKYFDISIDIKIIKTESCFNKIPIGFEVQAVVKDNVFFENGKSFGINYRSNLSSGLITVVTLPLLDYKMIEFEDKLKKYFNGLVQSTNYVEENFEESIDKINIDNVHIFLIILAAAKVELKVGVASSVFKYFGVRHVEELLNKKYKELISGGYINDEKLTNKGIEVVLEKNLKAFISVIEERRENEDGWN